VEILESGVAVEDSLEVVEVVDSEVAVEDSLEVVDTIVDDSEVLVVDVEHPLSYW